MDASVTPLKDHLDKLLLDSNDTYNQAKLMADAANANLTKAEEVLMLNLDTIERYQTEGEEMERLFKESNNKLD